MASNEAEQLNPEVTRQLKAYFRQLNILFVVFVAGMVLFFLTVWIVTQGGEYPTLYQQNEVAAQTGEGEGTNPKGEAMAPGNSELPNFLRIVVPISGLALILVSNRLFNSRLKQAREGTKLFHKMEAYRAAAVLRYIILDGAAFLNLVAFLLAGTFLYPILCAVILFLFFMNRPTPAKMIQDLQLSDLETRVVQDHLGI